MEKYIDYYGYEFIMRNINKKCNNILEEGLKSYSKKIKAIYIVDHVDFPNLFPNLVKYDFIDMKNLEIICELCKNYSVQIFFQCIMEYDNDKVIEALNIITNNIKVRNNFTRLAPKIIKDYEGDEEEILKLFLEENFNKFIECLEDKYFTKKTSIYTLEFDYKKGKKYLNQVNDNNRRAFNLYLQDNDSYLYNLDKIEDYYIKKEQVLIKRIMGCKELEDAKSKIIYNLFGINYNDFQAMVLGLDNLYKTNSLVNKDLDIIKRIIEINNKKELVEYIRSIRYLTYFFADIDEISRNIAKKDIIKNVNFNAIQNSKGIIKLDGVNFTMLVHKILGLWEEERANKINDDIRLWEDEYIPNEYISCSIINQYFMETACGYGRGNEGLILGFNQIKKEDILALSPRDLEIDGKSLFGHIYNLDINYMLLEDLLLNSNKGHNEVTINRFRDKSVIKPDYFLDFDKVKDRTLTASKYIDVPVYVIDTERYAYKFVKYLKYLEKNDINLYSKYIERLKVQKNNYLNHYYNIINDYLFESRAFDKIEEEKIKRISK